MILGDLATRAKNANATMEKLNGETATKIVVNATRNIEETTANTEETTANTEEITTNTINDTVTATQRIADVSEFVNEISKKQEKKRINVGLSQETFEKIITVAQGKSASAVMEKLLDFAVQDVVINEAIVKKYYNTMKNKCKKQ